MGRYDVKKVPKLKKKAISDTVKEDRKESRKKEQTTYHRFFPKNCDQKVSKFCCEKKSPSTRKKKSSCRTDATV